MPNFFKSFFSGKSETPESEKQKNDQKNFEIFKYDGLRAQRMGRPDYAIKCFTEALAIEEDFETMGYLSQLYIPMGETEKARELLEKMAVMEPHVTSTFLTLAKRQDSSRRTEDTIARNATETLLLRECEAAKRLPLLDRHWEGA